MVNRGYSSVSAMYEAYKRLDSGDVILYFGDHDPSGLDMIRDIEDRMASFGVYVDVKPVALTWQQVQHYQPPPNPAKFEDPRAGWYIEQFGEISWELDAIPPRDLMEMCDDAIVDLIDMDQYLVMMDQEKADILEMKQKFGLT